MNSAVERPLLELERVRVELLLKRGPLAVVEDVSLAIGTGEAVGLVGESGSGKSMTARAVMRLLPGRSRVGGEIRFDGASVATMSKSALRSYRGGDVAMIYQDLRVTINPLRTIGDFLCEAPRARGISRRDAAARASQLLREVGIADGERRLLQYPHQLSGGLLQRVMIAAALMEAPRLILADEPTTALDVTTQEEVMAILDEQRRERGMALMLITHDLDLASAVTDRIVVMYAGVVVEVAPSRALHEIASHPYTVGLLAARPGSRRRRLSVIPGRPAAAYEAGPGCAFAARCPWAQERCRETRPELRPLDNHLVACHRAEELRGRIVYEQAEATP